MTKILCIIAALVFAGVSGASAPPPVYPRPGECVRQPDGTLLCLPCPDPVPGQPSTCVERGVVAEAVPIDSPLALAAAALLVGLAAARRLRK